MGRGKRRFDGIDRGTSKKRRRTTVHSSEHSLPASDPVATQVLGPLATVPPKTKKIFQLYAQKKVTLNTAVSVQNVIDWTPFSLYDHDAGGASTKQAFGLDQWNTFYSKYRVNSAKISLKIVPDGTWSTLLDFGMYVVLVVAKDGTAVTGLGTSDMTPTTIRQHQHDQQVKWFWCKPIPASAGGAPTRPVYEMDLYCVGHKIWNQTVYEYSMDDETEALFTASPTKNPRVNMFFMTGDGSNIAVAAQVNVEYKITSYATLKDRQELPESVL